MRSLLPLAAGLLLFGSLIMCTSVGSGPGGDAGAPLAEGGIDSAAGEGGASDAAAPHDGAIGDAVAQADQAAGDGPDATGACNSPCANGATCTGGICLGCTGPTVIPADASGDPNASGFASSVAVSGSTLLVGAPGGGGGTGAAYVFTQSGSAWTHTATLSPPAGVTYFGISGAISGSVAMVGAMQGGSQAVFVYEQTGTTWTPGPVLTPAADAGGGTGPKLALDGNTAVVAWPLSTVVYVGSGSAWTAQGTLAPAETPPYLYGSAVQAVAVSGDTAIVGFSGNNPAPSYYSWADVFVRTGTTWAEQASLAPPTLNMSEEYLGSVGISNGMAVITSKYPQNGYVYFRSGTAWTSPNDAGGASFAPPHEPDPAVASPGAVLAGSTLFGLTSAGWQSFELPLVDAGVLEYGASVARSGSTAVIGAAGGGVSAGAVLVYSCSP